MILAHRAFNFFSCNAKQEISLTLPYETIFNKTIMKQFLIMVTSQKFSIVIFTDKCFKFSSKYFPEKKYKIVSALNVSVYCQAFSAMFRMW